MARYTQVKRLADLDSFRAHVDGLGVEIPAADVAAADGAHAQPMTVTDGWIGDVVVTNRWTVLPMEGWDGEPDGSPSDLVRRRWDRFAMSGAGLVWGSVGPMALAWALAFVPSFIGGWRWWSRNSPAGLLDDGAPGDYWSFTAPQALTTVLNVLLRWVDIAVVAALTDTSTAALYTAASRLLLVGNFVNGAIMQAVSPMVADSLGRGDRRDAGELLGTGTAWLVALVWPLYVALIVMGAGFLELFGAEYRDAATALAILAVAMMVATGVGPIEAVLLMDGGSRLSLADNAVAVAAMLAIDVALVPSMGLRGAASGWAVGLLATNLLPLWQVWRRLSISPFGRAHAIAAIGAVAMMGAVTLATRSTLGDGLALAIVATAVGYGAHLALMTRFADELKLRDLRRALRKS